VENISSLGENMTLGKPPASRSFVKSVNRVSRNTLSNETLVFIFAIMIVATVVLLLLLD
jgi:hypothetical protein